MIMTNKQAHQIIESSRLCKLCNLLEQILSQCAADATVLYQTNESTEEESRIRKESTEKESRKSVYQKHHPQGTTQHNDDVVHDLCVHVQPCKHA